jgi:hypothetical protein
VLGSEASGSFCSEALFRSELVGGGCGCPSLPADEASERVAVDVALLRRKNLCRALCRRVLMLLMPLQSRRRPACSRERCSAAVASRQKEKTVAVSAEVWRSRIRYWMSLTRPPITRRAGELPWGTEKWQQGKSCINNNKAREHGMSNLQKRLGLAEKRALMRPTPSPRTHVPGLHTHASGGAVVSLIAATRAP